MPHPKFHRPGIVLIAGIILIVVTLLAGVSVFGVMERQSELLNTIQRALQISGDPGLTQPQTSS